MARAISAAFLLSFLALTASFAHAEDLPLTFSLIRAVRLSDTSITLSYRTSVPAIGKVAYTEGDGSKFTLTDSLPQKDHLFTIDQLDPKHGYSFALSAKTDDVRSNTYTILLAPESIGRPGASLMPGFKETDVSGKVVSTARAASSTPAASDPIAPWWAFALLFVLAAGGWIGYGQYRHRHPLPPASP